MKGSLKAREPLPLSTVARQRFLNKAQPQSTVAPHKRTVVESCEGIPCRHRVVRGHARQRASAVGPEGSRRAQLNARNYGVQNTVRVDRGVPSSLSHRFGVGSFWHGGILQRPTGPVQGVVCQSASSRFVGLLVVALYSQGEAAA